MVTAPTSMEPHTPWLSPSPSLPHSLPLSFLAFTYATDTKSTSACSAIVEVGAHLHTETLTRPPTMGEVGGRWGRIGSVLVGGEGQCRAW